MIYFIVGRTSSGKDYLQSILVDKYGWKPVVSYTTRARRDGEGDTHNFITHEEADTFDSNEKVAETRLMNTSGVEDVYFATYQQLFDSDCYIVDPKGFWEIVNKFPDMKFAMIYLKPESIKKQRASFISRNGKDSGDDFSVRHASEDQMFRVFEREFSSKLKLNDSCRDMVLVLNTYKSDVLKSLAKYMNYQKELFDMLDGYEKYAK